MPTNDDVATISWWLSPENAKSREALAEHRPELDQWLSKVQEVVEARMGSFMMKRGIYDGEKSNFLE
jgi:hypothetical protein